jgi:hypothetical protein
MPVGMTVATIAVRLLRLKTSAQTRMPYLERGAQAMMTREGDCDRGTDQLE